MDALQIIAEPTRREILGLIWDRELAAGEIAERFDVTFGAVSQHLGVLRDAGMVTVRKEGTRRMYTADRDVLAPYRAILEQMWSNTLQRLADAIEAEEDR
jgi:DNA-binding transcriptional ArsR family regulator